MLLVALHEMPTFARATEHMPQWNGWSADTAERGVRELKDKKLLTVTKQTKKEPLSPTVLSIFNKYTLLAPFDKAPRDADSATTPTRDT